MFAKQPSVSLPPVTMNSLSAALAEARNPHLYTKGDLYKIVCTVLQLSQGKSLRSMDAAAIQNYIDKATDQLNMKEG